MRAPSPPDPAHASEFEKACVYGALRWGEWRTHRQVAAASGLSMRRAQLAVTDLVRVDGHPVESGPGGFRLQSAPALLREHAGAVRHRALEIMRRAEALEKIADRLERGSGPQMPLALDGQGAVDEPPRKVGR